MRMVEEFNAYKPVSALARFVQELSFGRFDPSQLKSEDRELIEGMIEDVKLQKPEWGNNPAYLEKIELHAIRAAIAKKFIRLSKEEEKSVVKMIEERTYQRVIIEFGDPKFEHVLLLIDIMDEILS